MRCLFINWNDGHPATQITVPDDYSLQRRLGTRRRPSRFTVFSDDGQTELYIDVRLVRSAYLITIGADQRIVDLSAA